MLLLLLGSFGDAIVRKEIVIVCNKSVVKNEDFEIGILGDYILLSSPLFGDFSFLVKFLSYKIALAMNNHLQVMRIEKQNTLIFVLIYFLWAIFVSFGPYL